MRACRWLGVGVLVAAAAGAGRAQIPAGVRFLGVGETGIARTSVEDAIRVGETVYAVGSSTTATSAGDATIWTIPDGGVVRRDTLPDLGAVGIHASVSALAITPSAEHVATPLRKANGASGRRAVRVTRSPFAVEDLSAPPYFPLDALGSIATAISDAGDIVYGNYASRAWRFNVTARTAVAVPTLAGRTANAAADRGTSADGSILVGTAFTPGANSSDSLAFRYVHGGGAGAILPLLPGASGGWSRALAISPDGNLTLAAGNSMAFPNGEVFLHDATIAAPADPRMRLGSPNQAWLPTGFGGVSADGSVVAVTFSNTGNPGLFAGTAPSRYAYLRNSQGWFHLTSALAASEIDVAAAGWSQLQISGLSSDGTLVFGTAFHGSTPEGFVAEFPPGYLAAYDPRPSPPGNTTIVGAWQFDGSDPGETAAIAFMADGTYYHLQATGFERGIYTWDGVTGALGVVTVQDTNGDDGLSQVNGRLSDVTFDAASGRLSVGSSQFPGARISGGPGSITGGWIVGDPAQTDSSAVIVLTAGGTYFHAQDGDSATDPWGADGVEIGTFQWQAPTGVFAANLPPMVDTNGEWGLSHPSGPATARLSADELQVIVTEDAGSITGTRIVDPATVVPVMTSPLTASATATTPFTYTIAASRSLTFDVPDAPAWLSVDSETGVVSGTPPVAGTVAVTIAATNTFGDSATATLVLAIAAPNTSAGSGVVVEPAVPPGSASVSLTFSTVTEAGETTVTAVDPGGASAPAPPTGFSLGDPPIYYEVTTTAEFEGPVTLCFSYAGVSFEGGTPRLFHHEGGGWVDITTSVDPATQTICGAASSFSPFAIFVSPIVRRGFHAPVSAVAGFVNTVKGGSTVPLKFNVFVDGVEKTETTGLTFLAWSVACSTSAVEDPVDFTTTGGTSLRYDTTAGTFVQNWKTPTVPGCYLVRMTTVADGLSIGALFKVK